MAWSRLTPWWWAYAPLAAVELILLVLYFGGWGARDAIYVLIRVLSFAAVGLSAIDLSRHKASYNRRRYGRRKSRSRGARRIVGLFLGAGGAILAALSAVLWFAHDSDGAGSSAFFASVLVLTAMYLLIARRSSELDVRDSKSHHG